MQMNGDGTRRGSGARSRVPDDAPPGGPSDEAEDAKPRYMPDGPEQLARDTVYRLLAARARSRSELRQALLRKEIDENVADAVLQKFVDAGLVDDASFAEEWVHSRQRRQGLGRKALGFELRRKGVDEHVVEAALSAVDGDAEGEQARKLVRRKLRTMANLDHAAKTRRLVGMLARKGYSEGLAFRVVREEIERSGADAPDPDLEFP